MVIYNGPTWDCKLRVAHISLKPHAMRKRGRGGVGRLHESLFFRGVGLRMEAEGLYHAVYMNDS